MRELDESTSTRPQRCILMGHSMGCITAATAALDPSLPPQHTTLVLVAPALSSPSSKKMTAEQRRASARRAATSAAGGGVGGAGSGDGLLRGGGRRGTGSSRGEARGIGLGGVLGTVGGTLVKAPASLLHAGVWFFNWCLLPMLYPLEILGLRCVGSYSA